MIDFIFTQDYEIYGNGYGSLGELVLEPTERLSKIFREFGAPFVNFTEAVEFQKIEEAGSDPDSAGVRSQLRELRAAGHEIALHLHPWWANARYEGGRWHLDWSERKIGTLEPKRVETIVVQAIGYLRAALNDPHFAPLSFRAGQWAIQPEHVIVDELVKRGIRVDSSVFKGGHIRSVGIDYRPAAANGGFWRFTHDVNVPNAGGKMWEVPIYTELVPFWQMIRRKRLKLQSKSNNASQGSPLPHQWRDLVRFLYPRKLDFCRMTFEEMRDTTMSALKKTRKRQEERAILVAIGHSKDFVDSDSVRRFLAFLREQAINVTTFSQLICQEPTVLP
jgi:hypothetical protein